MLCTLSLCSIDMGLDSLRGDEISFDERVVGLGCSLGGGHAKGAVGQGEVGKATGTLSPTDWSAGTPGSV